jgi:hypothetical protein
MQVRNPSRTDSEHQLEHRLRRFNGLQAQTRHCRSRSQKNTSSTRRTMSPTSKKKLYHRWNRKTVYLSLKSSPYAEKTTTAMRYITPSSLSPPLPTQPTDASNTAYTSTTSYKVERCTPQLNITQCFNCYDYGHRAIHCNVNNGVENAPDTTTRKTAPVTKPMCSV